MEQTSPAPPARTMSSPGRPWSASKTVPACFCSNCLAVSTDMEAATSLTGTSSRLAVTTTSGRERGWAEDPAVTAPPEASGSACSALRFEDKAKKQQKTAQKRENFSISPLLEAERTFSGVEGEKPWRKGVSPLLRPEEASEYFSRPVSWLGALRNILM